MILGRRRFLGSAAFFLSGVLDPGSLFSMNPKSSLVKKEDTFRSTVFRSVHGEPSENLRKVLALMGGIKGYINRGDVVLVKPNGQWWNQGGTNLACLEAFVDEVFNMEGGFEGQVVLAENCHRGPQPWNSIRSGWAGEFKRNSDIDRCRNLSDLAGLLKKRYQDRFSVVHWINVGAGAGRVGAGAQSEGYVYCDGSGGSEKLLFSNGLEGRDARTTMAAYPVFRTDHGTLVDFRQGVFRDGAFEKDALKFVNFSALNHHSGYAGVTSCVKNYMGITDLSGGPDPNEGGLLQPGIYNFHSFPFDKWEKGPVPGMLGAEMGFFMSKVRKADLNIVTAQWAGLSTRTELPAARTQVVLASTDPVALDFHSAKYVLHPNSRIRFHDPDWESGPLHQYLEACAKMTGDVLDESGVEVVSWDFEKGRLQTDEELVVRGERFWGSDPKQLAKYFALRFLPFLFNG